jgi:hypothetical protein
MLHGLKKNLVEAPRRAYTGMNPGAVPTDVMSEPSKRYTHINPTPTVGSEDGTSSYSSSWLPFHRPLHVAL